MKILMFGWELPPFNSGGLGVACYGLSKALTDQNIDITFVLPHPVPVQTPFLKLIFADPKTRDFDADELISAYVSSSGYDKLRQRIRTKYLGNSLMKEVQLYAIRAEKIAREQLFDVIHAHDWLAIPAGIAAKNASGKPLIVHIHATEFDRSGDNINPDVYEIEKEGMEKADLVIAVSNFTKSIIVNRYGINPDKIAVVVNGIDSENYTQSINREDFLSNLKVGGYKLVLFVGRITLQKGPDYFLKAAARVLQVNPKVRFIMTGTGDMEQQIINEAVAMGISDKVIFTGFIRDENLKNRLYQSADLFVLSSVSEPFGITPLESIVNGTPVLISKQSGVAEVLNHALKVDFWDTEEMANKILAVLKHDSLQKCLSRNSQSEVKKISWKEAALKCAKLYQKITLFREVN